MGERLGEERGEGGGDGAERTVPLGSLGGGKGGRVSRGLGAKVIRQEKEKGVSGE